MGNDAEAHVFYGYCWIEEVEFVRTMEEWAEQVLKAGGTPDPWASHPGGSQPDWVAQNREAIDAWRAAKKSLIDAQPVWWDIHASYENPMPYLYVRGTRTTCEWGAPAPLDPDAFAVDLFWKLKLDAFLAAAGVAPPEGPNQPGWWTAAFWG